MEPTVKKEDGRYAISMAQVSAAYKKVRSNKGAGGVDGMSWEEFDKHQKELLYKLWNRMTSGSYFPQATREVIIPKAGGGERRLGIPILLGQDCTTIGSGPLRTIGRKRVSSKFIRLPSMQKCT
jgi:retron-type reverse transcriptase